MSELRAVCEVCDEPVDANSVEAHMDRHGLLIPRDWRLRTWPDGAQVLLPPEEAGP